MMLTCSSTVMDHNKEHTTHIMSGFIPGRDTEKSAAGGLNIINVNKQSSVFDNVRNEKS